METLTSTNNFPILASSSSSLESARVLKHGDTFAVFDRSGDMQPGGAGEEGLYHEGTRFLCRLVLLLDDRRPLLLSSTVKQDNTLLLVDLTNADYIEDGNQVLPRDTIHIFRSSYLWSGTCYTRFRIHNYSLSPVDCTLSLYFDADFADIFEVRGHRRASRGKLMEPALDGDSVRLAYRGLDGVSRITRLRFSPSPRTLSDYRARFETRIPAGSEVTYYISISCESETAGRIRHFDGALEEAVREMKQARSGHTSVHSSNAQFNQWLQRSSSDLSMMETRTPWGPYPYAGVPWFSAPFGRDGIITALEYLWISPDMARGVLAFLAANQATDLRPDQDAEPGKILHEARKGEMAALGEIPFGCYYGSVDATPLFVLLAGEYHRRTADRSFIESIWDNIELALAWIDAYGDLDGDGFVEYARRTSRGLAVQGWKDSFDSVFHADGSLAEGPVALCEVQAYVYAALCSAADLAARLNREERARELAARAASLRKRFEEAFWCEEIGTYALALDGQKKQCRVRTSNAGHCLFAGIAAPERAEIVARTLLDPSSFSGWGIRTVAAAESRYNPMSYHNGSVWPHDNAIIASGLARYGFKPATLQVFSSLFDAALFVDLHRMPELFCGFVRRPGEGPTLYPVACAPQSWAAASVFMLLQACLGLTIDASGRQIRFTHAALPESLDQVTVRSLGIGPAVVDLALERHAEDVGITVLRRDGPVEIITVK